MHLFILKICPFRRPKVKFICPVRLGITDHVKLNVIWSTKGIPYVRLIVALYVHSENTTDHVPNEKKENHDPLYAQFFSRLRNPSHAHQMTIIHR